MTWYEKGRVVRFTMLGVVIAYVLILLFNPHEPTKQPSEIEKTIDVYPYDKGMPGPPGPSGELNGVGQNS